VVPCEDRVGPGGIVQEVTKQQASIKPAIPMRHDQYLKPINSLRSRSEQLEPIIAARERGRRTREEFRSMSCGAAALDQR
jgi:hypothetical protein